MNPAKTTWFYGEERFAEILSFVADARSRGERRNVAHERYICFILGTARLASAAERASNRVSTCTWMHQVLWRRRRIGGPCFAHVYCYEGLCA